MKIPIGSGAYIEPDEGPRDTRFHRRVLSIEPIEGTRSGNRVALDCGHCVQTFGDLTHAAGVVLCTQCRDYAEEKGGKP
jgi:hypothetical protein